MFLKNIGLIETVTSDRNDSGFHKLIYRYIVVYTLYLLYINHYISFKKPVIPVTCH